MGKQFCELGFLIARDPVYTPVAARKMTVPGVIGSSIFSEMRTELANMDGAELKTWYGDAEYRKLSSSVLTMYEEQYF